MIPVLRKPKCQKGGSQLHNSFITCILIVNTQHNCGKHASDFFITPYGILFFYENDVDFMHIYKEWDLYKF